jgi:ribosomal protein S18 acetylase RimI-like enzyme
MEIGVNRMQFVRNAFLCQKCQYAVRKFRHSDSAAICSWVTNQEMLSMISGDTGNGLNTEILEKWVTTAILSIVVFDTNSDNVVGFCTVTIKELPTIKHKYIELCHLVFNPNYCLSRYEIGLQLTSRAEEIAFIYGFDCIIGRVVPSNNYAKKLAQKANWDVFDDDFVPENFYWYKKQTN